MVLEDMINSYSMVLLRGGKCGTFTYDVKNKKTVTEHVRVMKLGGYQVVLLNEHKQKIFIPFQRILQLEDGNEYTFFGLYKLIVVDYYKKNNNL